MLKTRTHSNPKICEWLRKTILDLDLRKTYAESQIAKYENDYQLHSRLGGKRSQSKAMRDKIYLSTHKIYLENLESIKKGVDEQLEYCLRGYGKKQRKIWVMHFIESKALSEISKSVGMKSNEVSETIERMKEDLIDESDIQD